jgi:hypothetical protein
MILILPPPLHWNLFIFFTKCVNGFGGYLLVDVEQFILKFFVTFSFITEKANGIETEEIQ